MNHTPKRFTRLCLAVYLVWLGCSVNFAAEAEDPAPPSAPPEVESPQPDTTQRPANAPAKKRSKRRAKTVHATGPQMVEIGRDFHVAAGGTVRALVGPFGMAVVDGPVEGNLVVFSDRPG